MRIISSSPKQFNNNIFRTFTDWLMVLLLGYCIKLNSYEIIFTYFISKYPCFVGF